MGGSAATPTDRHGGAAFWRARTIRRDLGWLFGISLGLNAVIWGLDLVWNRRPVLIPLSGLCVILLNSALTVVFVRKEAVLTQALAATALAIQLLLLILVIRTGIVGL